METFPKRLNTNVKKNAWEGENPSHPARKYSAFVYQINSNNTEVR